MAGKRRVLNTITGVLAQLLLAAGAGGAAEAADDAPAALDEVIVTALKRAENVQDVPVSISVLSGQRIADMQISDLRTLQGYVPNMAILNSGVNPVVYIRGFGSGPNNVAFDQEVSVYLDGVYGGRGAQFTAPFFDLERMEVLRGPQGALFGKNTAAGAISIVSARPTATAAGAATAGYNFERDGWEASGFVSGPIGQTLGARLAVKVVDQDGFLKNLATGKDDPQLEEELARFTLAWTPSEAFDVTGKLEYGRHHLDGGVTHSGSLTAPTHFTKVRHVSEPYANSPFPEESGITSYNGALTANYRFGDLTLTSVTGYSSFKTKRLTAYDEFSPDRTIPPAGSNARFANGFPEDFEQFSQELRLTSPAGGRLEYIVGVYYDDSDYHLINTTYYKGVVGGALTGVHQTDFYQDGKTYSAFGQGTYRFADTLRLVGSLRYSETHKQGLFLSRLMSGQRLNPEGRAQGKLKEHYTDPSITLQWDAADKVMVYATFARGSKSGGFVSNTASTTDATFRFKPERSTNYEAGVKSTLLDGRLTANLAVFHMTFEDLQQSTYDPDRRTFFTRNAAEASSEGVEFDMRWLPIDSLELSANVAYLDAKFDDYPGAPCLATETVAQCNSADPASLLAHNIKGTPLLFSPKWSGAIAARHTLTLSNDWRMVTNVNALFRSRYFMADGYSPVWGLQDGWLKWDARVQVGPGDDRWHVALVGRNLTNRKTVGQAIRFPASITGVARTQNWMDEYRSLALEGTLRFW